MNNHIPSMHGSNGVAKAPMEAKTTYTSQSCDIWTRVEELRKRGKVLLNGSDLDIASIIAVAKYNCEAYVDATETLVHAMNGSVQLLEEYLSQGHHVYGVNTGFGGSADTRTSDLVGLQSALLQLTQAGILGEADTVTATSSPDLGSCTMPVTWMRAAMLVRCNNAVRGHSGVRLKLVDAILHLLRNEMTPVVPLRGSISASGDLIPLSYIAGVLEGNPDIFVRIENGMNSKIVPAHEALAIAGLEPFVLGPKEGLGLINGTAVSTAVGCLAAHEANKLALLSQVLVAMSCEALLGNIESYHPFIADVRPHPGQIECASNLAHFLRGSSLVQSAAGLDKFRPGLIQDRYALRGAPQWLGPQLEDLSSVLFQLTLEVNSTSDNPIIDVKAGAVYSGANFIAASVSSGMEKSRLSMQMIGKLLFSLSSELINPTLNKGLPPNLAADDPSLSFTMKGIDISMAAYMSELAFLANPVTSHVQSAESHNQSINSLALISARYTMTATDIVAHMCAAHLYAVCQALDLRVLHICYLRTLQEKLWSLSESILPEMEIDHQEKFQNDLYKVISTSWNATTSLDLAERCDKLGIAAFAVLLDHCQTHQLGLTTSIIGNFQQHLRDLAEAIFITSRNEFFYQQNTISFLGGASKAMYTFVRKHLGVPFHRGLVEHPARDPGASIDGRVKKTIGSWVSIIFNAIRDDKIWLPMLDAIAVGQ